MTDYTRTYRESGHPLDVMDDLESRFLNLAAETGAELNLGEAIPNSVPW